LEEKYTPSVHPPSCLPSPPRWIKDDVEPSTPTKTPLVAKPWSEPKYQSPNLFITEETFPNKTKKKTKQKNKQTNKQTNKKQNV